ncbi:MAG: hypothetical protein ACRD6X_20900 [Pyrinomonadaceae bacterium]
MSILLFDIAVPGGGIVFAAVGVGFFLVLAAVTFLAFRLLRKTFRMAIRLGIVGLILVVGFFGGGLLIYLGIGVAGSKPRQPPRPGPTKQR